MGLRASGVDQVLDDLDQLETMMGRMPDGAERWLVVDTGEAREGCV